MDVPSLIYMATSDYSESLYERFIGKNNYLTDCVSIPVIMLFELIQCYTVTTSWSCYWEHSI